MKLSGKFNFALNEFRTLYMKLRQLNREVYIVMNIWVTNKEIYFWRFADRASQYIYLSI